MSERKRPGTELVTARPGATDDRVRPHLPLTAEVGGERGSYADPTYQVATFEGDLPKAHDTAGPDPGPAPTHDMIRYPTESPDAPAGSAGRAGGLNWRAGAIGAAAGAIAVIGVEWLRRTSR